MSTRQRRSRQRLARFAAGTVVLWAAAVGAAFWYLRRMQGDEARRLALTDADSIGLPLLAFAVLAAGVLLLANLVAAVVLWRRGRREGGAAA